MGEVESIVEVKRSEFVTAVAWVAIVVAGFTCLYLVLDGITLTLVDPAGWWRWTSESQRWQELPWWAKTLAAHVHWIYLVMLGYFAGVLMAARGVLRRKDTARKWFMGLAVTGMVAAVGLMAAEEWLLCSDMPRDLWDTPWRVQAAMIMVMARPLVIAGATVGLMIWVVSKMTSPAVRSEFGVKINEE